MNTTDRKKRPCSHCGQAFAPEQLIPFQDELLCPACLDEQTTVCSCCGERIYKTDNSGTDTIPLCEDCYDNHYERCTHCGALIHRRDTYYRGDDPYCYDCYHTLPAQGINDYYFKPEPIFYGTGKRYFGVELEVDEGGESRRWGICPIRQTPVACTSMSTARPLVTPRTNRRPLSPVSSTSLRSSGRNC